MTTAIDQFLKRATAFARAHPAAVLDMEAPELAVDPRAHAHHLRTTWERVRSRMHTTARLALKPNPTRLPDFFETAAQPRQSLAERQTA